MDELSGGATTRRLPAPAGPRIPTGQVPVELPPGRVRIILVAALIVAIAAATLVFLSPSL